MRRRNRETEQFSISFLDVASCGFGAVIILLMITKSAAPTNEFFIDTLPTGSIEELTRQLFAIRSQTTELQEELNASERRNAEQERLTAGLDSQRRRLEAEFNLARDEGDAVTEEIGELLLAQQTLTEEMQRLFEQTQAQASSYIAGVPVDSEYIIFVIDNSPSMFDYAWRKMLEVIEQTLEVYPEVKGIQVMNDEGVYMFPSFRGGDWIPDSRERRNLIISTLRTWNYGNSNSNPVKGVTEAIRSFYEPGRKISVYVLGDDFQRGGSIEQVLRDIAQRNTADNFSGERLARIHTIGFPVIPVIYGDLQGFIRYASLMRVLTQSNGGTFIGLNDFR